MENIRVLIVEDDLKISQLHGRFTEKVAGFEVAGIANSIADASEMLEILEPDLVLLDLYFPEGSGMELLWELRKSGSRVDFILITAAKDAHNLQDAMRGGAFDYLVKPVVFERFRQSLEKYRTYITDTAGAQYLEQKDIDGFLRSTGTAADGGEVPKGIDPITLKKVASVFADSNEGKSAEEAAALIGASRNTARRYLEYLTETGYLYADIDYGTVGRPERKFYRMK